MADEAVPAIPVDWQGIAKQVLGILKANIAGYLKDHADTQQLLTKWSEQIAKLMIKRVFASPEDKAKDDVLIDIYKRAMKEELDAVTIDAEGLSHTTLNAVLDTMWAIFLQAAPIILKLLIP